jgi:hypothetical protein
MAMSFNVRSEVGRLRQVIVHRPGLELSRLTPRNVRDLLFDDVMWAKKAKEEHDAFAEALRDMGVRLHNFEQLLRETLMPRLPTGRTRPTCCCAGITTGCPSRLSLPPTPRSLISTAFRYLPAKSDHRCRCDFLQACLRGSGAHREQA